MSIPTKICSLMKRFFSSDFGLALGIALLWKLFMLAVGYYIDVQVNGGQSSILHHTANWDSNWYLIIISDHYIANAASAVFYPLFPLLVSTLHVVDPLLGGQIINTISVWIIILALLQLGRVFLGPNKKLWLVALLLAAPAGFFLHVFYSEALFMAIGFWAYVFALKRQWLHMGILLGFLTATRLPALLFIGLCALEFMRAYDWNIKKIFNKNLLYFLLTPLGFILYGSYLLITRGDFLGMFHAYSAVSDWAYQVFDINIVKTMLRITYEIFRALAGARDFTHDIFINHLLPVISLFVLGCCSLYLTLKQRGKYIPLGIFGLAAIVMFTLNSNVVSVHRYVLPCLTIPIALALVIKGKYQFIGLLGICLCGSALQLLLLSLFIGNTFVG